MPPSDSTRESSRQHCDLATLPLSGLRVLDFTHVIAGPFATMMLAHMGADVVKIERTGGEPLRHIPGFKGRDGHSDYFNAVNVSKKSIALNLKDPVDQSLVQDLVKQADVVIENFAPGTADRLKLGWEDFKKINPNLVYCSISGYGQTGPDSKKPATDPMIQGVSGLMSVTGVSDGPPTLVGAPVADVTAGMCAAYTIVTNLLAIEKGGPGRYIDISMQAAMMFAMGPRMAETLQAGVVPPRMGNQNFIRVPSDVCISKDGKYAFVHCSNDSRWQAMCRIMEKPEWAEDERYETMESRLALRAELNRLVGERFAERTLEEWRPRFEAEKHPFMQIHDYAEAIDHPQIKHREQIVELEHDADGPIRFIGPPWKITGHQPKIESPPLYDADKDTVMREWLGWSDDQIKAYQAKAKS
ncbi:MAG: CoA transferase [Rhodospirillaceae bacterium]|jgi:crotonobetainyl-CoA:carnitine CoA-transferase CaiB-like acyl-CoA transferase